MTPLTDLEPGRYVCPVCERRFLYLAEKKAHMRLKHPRN